VVTDSTSRRGSGSSGRVGAKKADTDYTCRREVQEAEE